MGSEKGMVLERVGRMMPAWTRSALSASRACPVPRLGLIPDVGEGREGSHRASGEQGRKEKVLVLGSERLLGEGGPEGE